MRRWTVSLAVLAVLVLAGNVFAGQGFPGGDSLWVEWEVEGTDTIYNIVRVDEVGDTLTVKVKHTVDSDGQNVAILGPYTGLRANAYSIWGEHMDFACGIRDTAMHERLSTCEGPDDGGLVLTDSTWYTITNEGILFHEAFVRNWVVGAAANYDTLHLDCQRDILWRRNDPYMLVRWKIRSNEPDAAVAGNVCRGMAVVAADGDTVQVTASCVTADSTLCTINFDPVGPDWVGAPKILTRWDGGFTIASSGNETAAVPVDWTATRLGVAGDSLRFVWYSAAQMGYASGLHDVGYLVDRGEIRRDCLSSNLSTGAFAAVLNIGNASAGNDTLADGTSSYFDADSLYKTLGSGPSQWLCGWVAFNPGADIVPTAVGFDDSTDFLTTLPYDSTWTVGDTTSALDGGSGTDRYVIFRTDPVYLDGVTYQTFEYAVGIGKIEDDTTPVHPIFPDVVFMDGTPYQPAMTKRVWHD